MKLGRVAKFIVAEKKGFASTTIAIGKVALPTGKAIISARTCCTALDIIDWRNGAKAASLTEHQSL
jgi:hypothetical protein